MSGRIIANNKSAYFHFEIIDKFTAGLVLLGVEIKSVRSGKVSFNDTFCIVHNMEIIIKNLFISPYEFGTNLGYNPTRDRKLLLQKQEIDKLHKKIKEKGYSIVPLQIFINQRGFAKIDVALARGKKNYDKRNAIMKREAERSIKQFI